MCSNMQNRCVKNIKNIQLFHYRNIDFLHSLQKYDFYNKKTSIWCNDDVSKTDVSFPDGKEWIVRGRIVQGTHHLRDETSENLFSWDTSVVGELTLHQLDLRVQLTLLHPNFFWIIKKFSLPLELQRFFCQLVYLFSQKKLILLFWWKCVYFTIFPCELSHFLLKFGFVSPPRETVNI